jgi:hypothetical protein
MKKIVVFSILLCFQYFSFSQIQIVSEKQITIDEEAGVKVIPTNNRGFILVQNFQNEESSSLTTWRFTYYNISLADEWTKNIILEKKCDLVAYNTDNWGISLVYIVKNNASINVQDLTIVHINDDGVVNKKDVELEKTSSLHDFVFLNDLCFFSATTVQSNVFENNDLETIYAINFTELSISKKQIVVPDIAEIKELLSFDNSLCFRVHYNQNNIIKDSIYYVEQNRLENKIPINLPKETSVESINLIKTDSVHYFLLGITKRWISGVKNIDENYEYLFFISKLEKNENLTIKNVEKKFINEFENSREIHLLHDRMGHLNDWLLGNKYIINNSFRLNNKNYIIFDKYQTNRAGFKQNKTPEAYFYTNSIIWCFNDDGEVEWSKNIDYEIITPFLNGVTYGQPNSNNSIALIGQFEDECAVLNFSTDNPNASGNDKFKTSNEIDMDDYQVKSNITHLFNCNYVVWGIEDESYEQTQKRLKNKIYDIKFNLKVIEVK